MKENNTGTYVYDPELKKVVKVSSRVPSVKKASHSCAGGCCGCHHAE